MAEDFDTSQCVAREDVTPAEWSKLDQNMAQARDWLKSMTALQLVHIVTAHESPDDCHVPCSSAAVINALAKTNANAAKVLLHMLICDAAKEQVPTP